MINYFDLVNLFGDKINKSYIFHIPHSSSDIPDRTGFIEEKIVEEIDLLTDHSTDKIFDLLNVDKLIFPHSRIFCDVERLDDDLEPMYKFGRGFYYTKTDGGDVLRISDENHKQIIYKKYYLPHHNQLRKMVEDKLNSIGFAIIVDCHSFSNTPFKTDLDKENDRPDICIGVDDFHTPKDWLYEIKKSFENNGLVVKVNSPYSGTIIPIEYYKQNENVMSIMIEINKRVYMHNNKISENSINRLNSMLKDIFIF